MKNFFMSLGIVIFLLVFVVATVVSMYLVYILAIGSIICTLVYVTSKVLKAKDKLN